MTDSRIVRFLAEGREGFGLLHGDGLNNISARHGARWSGLKAAIASGELERFVEVGSTGPVDYREGEFRFLPAFDAPEKIICVGVNFPDRNEEYKDGQAAPSNPSLFIRFPGSFTGHGEPLIRPPESHQLDYEGEIVLIIGKAGRRIEERNALDHVAALTLCNEGTLRDWVRHAKFNVTQGKNFDRSGSIGPWLVPFRDEAQIADIALLTRVNGEIRQQDRTARMIFSFRKIIAYISTFTTLTPGDVIVTGTPTGAGARFDPPKWLKPGDVIEVEADGIGILRNGVADEGSSPLS